VANQYRRLAQTDRSEEARQIGDDRPEIISPVRLITLAVTALVQGHNAQRLFGQEGSDEVPDVRR
jgi:hypothetical protein